MSRGKEYLPLMRKLFSALGREEPAEKRKVLAIPISLSSGKVIGPTGARKTRGGGWLSRTEKDVSRKKNDNQDSAKGRRGGKKTGLKAAVKQKETPLRWSLGGGEHRHLGGGER